MLITWETHRLLYGEANTSRGSSSSCHMLRRVQDLRGPHGVSDRVSGPSTLGLSVWRDQTACHRSCETVAWQLNGAKGLHVHLPQEAAYRFQQCGEQSEQSLSGVWICAGLRKKGSTLCRCQVPACSAHQQAHTAASPIASASCWLCKPTKQIEVSGKLERLTR